MAMQFKTMTQMTQMTQGHADKITWCMLPAGASMWHGGQWPPARSAGWPAWPATCGWGTRAGPAAKGRQKRTDREQFFFLQNLVLFAKIFFVI
jgi:hypothetical protein